MFILRVHSVEADNPLDPQLIFSVHKSQNPKFTERRGVVHLFRNTSHSSLPNPKSTSSLVFIVAVPNYLSFDDLIRFCGPHLDNLDYVLFIRNDGMEDRYSVLIKFVDQFSADGFYSNFNGKKFSPGEAEICHILYLHSVEYSEYEEVAGTPPAGCTEIPTCPVCLERLDPDTSGILTTLCDHSFQCPCVSKWTYLSCQVCRFCQQQDEKPTCFICGLDDVWVCMICGFVGCGRYKEGHAIRHWKDTHHCYSLGFKTQQIWDYVGDNYVHRLNQDQSKIDGKLEENNFRCTSLEGDCDACECHEDLEINGAFFNSKVEAMPLSARDSTDSAVREKELSILKKKNPLAALKLMLSLQSSSTNMANSSSTTSLSSINQESTEGLLRQLKTKILEGDLIARIEQNQSECFEIKSILQKLHKSEPHQALLAFLIEFGPHFEQLSINIKKRSSTLKHKDQEVMLHQQEIDSLEASQAKIDALEAQAAKDEEELAQWDSKIQRYNEEIKILQTKLANAEFQKSRVQERMGAPALSKRVAEAVIAIKHLDNANQHQATIAQLDKELGFLETSIALSVGILDRLKASLQNL